MAQKNTKNFFTKIILSFFVLSLFWSPSNKLNAQVLGTGLLPVNDAVGNVLLGTQANILADTNIAVGGTWVTSNGQLVQETVSVVKESMSAWNSFVSSAMDKANNLKEWVLDGLAKAAAQALIRKMTAATVDWINGGFEGKPAFLSDPQSFLTDTIDEEIGRYLVDKQGLDWLCSPFSLQIRISIAKGYYNYTPPKCKLTDMVKNVEGFVNNNGGVGWNNFLELTQPNGNPYASYLKAQNDLGLKIDMRFGKESKTLDWGQGFFSWDTCTEEQPVCLDGEVALVNNNGTYGSTRYSSAPVMGTDGSVTTGLVQNLENSANQTAPAAGGTCKNPGKPKCTKTQTNTPGSVIQTQVNDILPSGLRGLEMADEINEILGALMSQVLTKVLSAGSGLLGMSEKNSSNGGSSVMDRLQDENSNLSDEPNSSYNDIKQNLATNYSNQQQQVADGANAADASANLRARAEYERFVTDNSNAGLNMPVYPDYYGGQNNNVALSKPTTQSSTADNGNSVYAVDGITTGTMNGNSHPSITNEEAEPWWMVDLGKTYKISKIKVWRRLDITPEESLGTFQVTVGSSDNLTSWDSGLIFADSELTNPVVLDESSTIATTSSSMSGRYIKIARSDFGSLQLAEVEVFGQAVQVGFKPLKNSSVSLYKDTTIATQNKDFKTAGIIVTNGQASGMKFVVSLTKQDTSSLANGLNYVPINTLFTLLKMKVDKATASSTVTNFIPEINPNLMVATVKVGEDLSLDPDYQYGLILDGYLRDVSEINVGTYVLRQEIRDIDNNIVGVQTTTFNVQ